MCLILLDLCADALDGRRIRVNDYFLLEVEVTAQGSDAEADNACLCDSIFLLYCRAHRVRSG